MSAPLDPRAFDPTAVAGNWSDQKASSEVMKSRRIVKVKRRSRASQKVAVAACMPPPVAETAAEPQSGASLAHIQPTTLTVTPLALPSDTPVSSALPSSLNPFSGFSMSVEPSSSNGIKANPFAGINLAPSSSTSSHLVATSTAEAALPKQITLQNTSHPFVIATFKERLPKILDSIMLKNAAAYSSHPDVIQSLKDLKSTLLAGPVSRVMGLRTNIVQNALWQAHLLTFIKESKCLNQIDTFLLENLIYRYVMDSIHYFASSKPTLCRQDPFKKHKVEALQHADTGGFDKVESLFRKFIAEGSDVANQGTLSSECFADIVKLMLWGNRADLSLSAGEVDETSACESSSSSEVVPKTMLLADNTSQVWNDIEKFDNWGIILDNCGLELVTDLVFAEILLSSGCADTVTLYAKSHPVFVSDCLIDDVEQHIKWVQEKLGDSCCLSDHYHSTQKLKVVSDPFFTSGYKYREISSKSPNLAASFRKHDLLVFKGDANYRRLLGEREWDPTTPFSKVVDYFPYASTLALRTLKYPLAAGISADKVALAKSTYGDLDWNCTGQCGVVQFCPASSL